MSTWDLASIERAFAVAALDPSRWDDAMEVASKALGAVGAVLLPAYGRMPQFPSSRSLDDVCEVYVRDGWFARDARDRSLSILAQRSVVTDEDAVPAEEHGGHPYYQEFLAPFGLRWFAGVRVAAANDAWTLSVQRSIAQGPFAPHELPQLASLSTRLGTSAVVAQALGFACAEGAVAAFETSGHAVFQIDRTGGVIRANKAAEKLLGSNLNIAHRHLTSRDRDATISLDRALHEMLWNGKGELSAPVPLPRQGQYPLIAHVMRLSTNGRELFAACRALIVIVDPEVASTPSESILRAAFGLTPAESRLAASLSTGIGLHEAATALGVGRETLRTQLKHVFAKLNINRQAELVSILARLSVTLHDNG